MTKRKRGDIINLAADETATKHHGDNNSKNFLKKVEKKLLTSTTKCAIVNKLSLRQQNMNLDNKTVYSNPENSLRIFGTKPKHR